MQKINVFVLQIIPYWHIIIVPNKYYLLEGLENRKKVQKMTDKKFFYGHEVSPYGVENGRVDYRTFASCFDAILNNGIIEATAEIGYWEQVSGIIDNSDEIYEIREQIEELEDLITEDSTDEQDEETSRKIDELEEQIEELERQQEEPAEIFQYFIVSDNALPLLEEANEIVYHNDTLDINVWGVTHWGTSWDYVLTSIEL